MEGGILKYQRIQGAFESLFDSNDRITAAAIETNFLVVGTESGEVYILSFAGQTCKHFKPHEAPVNSISLCNDGGLVILSCSDNGDVVLTACGDLSRPGSSSDEVKETSFQFDLPIKSVCFEEALGAGSTGRGSKDPQLSFLAGAANGALIYRRAGWLKQKTVVLSPGSGTPVCVVRWRKQLVAWADMCTVRVMDISTQTAICRVSAPHGLLPEDGIACSLCFRSDVDLLIVWGASFRLLHVENMEASNAIEWFADSLMCGVVPVDNEHIAYLACSPPRGPGPAGSSAADEEDYPELIIATLRTGEIVYSSLLPLRGSVDNSSVECMLLSSPASSAWHLSDPLKGTASSAVTAPPRGGDRGLGPLFFVLGPADAVLGRLVDVNDRIHSALRNGHIRLALDLAAGDRSSLKGHSYADLLLFYLDHLLQKNMAEAAGREAARLVGLDVLLWEKVVKAFEIAGKSEAIALCLPTDRPRLSQAIYSTLLTTLLHAPPLSCQQVFVQVLHKWSVVQPALFDHDELLAALRVRAATAGMDAADARSKLWLVEAEAQLHLVAGNYDKVLSCYLDTDFLGSTSSDTADCLAGASGGGGGGAGGGAGMSSYYRNVFELIETNGLYSKVEPKIANLIRLSKPLSAKLLLGHLDKLPIRRIATVLAASADHVSLLHWYLHLLFTGPQARSEYVGDDPAASVYGDLHARQLQLYIDHAPRVLTKGSSNSSSAATDGSAELDMADMTYYRRHCFESDVIALVRAGLASTEQALRLAEAHQPVLYLEVIVLHLLSGEVKRGLAVILDDLANIPLAIEYIEHYYEEKLRAVQRPHGMRLAVSPLKDGNGGSNGGSGGGLLLPADASKQHYIELWDELIRHILKKGALASSSTSTSSSSALQSQQMLGTVLDYLPYCHIDPYLIVRAIRPQLTVPALKTRLDRLLRFLRFQQTLDQATRKVLASESVALTAQKNYGQRRAVKLSGGQLRCKACMRPLLFEPPPPSSSKTNASSSTSTSTSTNTSTGNSAHLLPVGKDHIQVWGLQQQQRETGTTTEGAVIFSNKLAFHRPCYDRITM